MVHSQIDSMSASEGGDESRGQSRRPEQQSWTFWSALTTLENRGAWFSTGLSRMCHSVCTGLVNRRETLAVAVDVPSVGAGKGV
jgi:hypothetical protein